MFFCCCYKIQLIWRIYLFVILAIDRRDRYTERPQFFNSRIELCTRTRTHTHKCQSNRALICGLHAESIAAAVAGCYRHCCCKWWWWRWTRTHIDCTNTAAAAAAPAHIQLPSFLQLHHNKYIDSRKCASAINALCTLYDLCTVRCTVQTEKSTQRMHLLSKDIVIEFIYYYWAEPKLKTEKCIYVSLAGAWKQSSIAAYDDVVDDANVSRHFEHTELNRSVTLLAYRLFCFVFFFTSACSA